VDRIDIPDDMRNRSDGKPRSLVDGAEGAVIPRAVSGHPDQEAVGLAGRTDGSLFETLIVVCVLNGCHLLLFPYMPEFRQKITAGFVKSKVIRRASRVETLVISTKML
jgi:hypothetical protein